MVHLVVGLRPVPPENLPAGTIVPALEDHQHPADFTFEAEQRMYTDIIAPGPPPLTEGAADAAVDMIDFIAAVVRGYDAIDVNEIVRPLWRAHLAQCYSYLHPVTRAWYASAAYTFVGLKQQWPMLLPQQQMALAQQWSYELPQMLLILDPVLAQAQSIAMQEQQRQHLDTLRQQMATPAAAVSTQKSDPSDELYRRAQMSNNLARFNNIMTNSTINLMHAMSPH